jgi:hypothetical protein
VRLGSDRRQALLEEAVRRIEDESLARMDGFFSNPGTRVMRKVIIDCDRVLRANQLEGDDATRKQ